MIDLQELKTVLEPLNLDAKSIEAIQGLDREVDDGRAEIDRLNGEIERINNEWNDRFRAAFFKGEGIPHDHEGEVTEQVDNQSDVETNVEEEGSGLATTFEELFGDSKEEN